VVDKKCNNGSSFYTLNLSKLITGQYLISVNNSGLYLKFIKE
jgi:hypothetical protein